MRRISLALPCAVLVDPGEHRRSLRAVRYAILPPIAAAAGTRLAPLLPPSTRSRRLSIPRLVIDVPTGVEVAPIETFEEITGELSLLIQPERPRRHTTQPPPVPRPRDDRAIGEWHVAFELGRGGTSAVYAATHREFGKRAALKLSHATIDSSLGAKVFLREARIVQLIEHPAIPDVFATGTHEGRPYLVMERLRGRTLTQVLEAGPIPRERALELLLAVTDALATAHAAGVVHRDLKLDNIFVVDQPGPAIKLLDWGFAHVRGEDDPLRDMIAGTLGYVAPEQLQAGAITPASDVYSLGVVAYRLLLGQAPSQVSDLAGFCRYLSTPPPHPALLWPGIPRGLANLLLAMLATAPADRPSLASVRDQLLAVRTPRRRSLSRRILTAITAIASVLFAGMILE